MKGLACAVAFMPGYIAGKVPSLSEPCQSKPILLDYRHLGHVLSNPVKPGTIVDI